MRARMAVGAKGQVYRRLHKSVIVINDFTITFA